MSSSEPIGTETYDVCIAGGGPAGMLAGLLFARAGAKTLVLEKHGDFLRDFRGDTVHPSTLELFAQLGLLDALLELPHDRVERISGRIAGRLLNIADFRHLPVAAPFIALMPQWDLLDFLAGEAKRYPGFGLRMGSEVKRPVFDSAGRVAGVELAGGKAVRARLVVAADGRHSVLREEAGLPIERIGAPMDVFWFRVPKRAAQTNDSFGIFESGRILVLIDRGDYWQAAFVFAKGEADIVRERGMSGFKRQLVDMEPQLEPGLAKIQDWSDVSLLRVAVDRLTRWHRPGLLAIGDAAHAMSPIGGVGINLAVQDAVAAANVLAGPMASGADPDPLLHDVQARRWKPTMRMQAMQRLIQSRVIEPLVSGRSTLERPPFAARLVNAVPFLQRIPGRIVGLGFGRERIESPDAGEGAG